MNFSCQKVNQYVTFSRESGPYSIQGDEYSKLIAAPDYHNEMFAIAFY